MVCCSSRPEWGSSAADSPTGPCFPHWPSTWIFLVQRFFSWCSGSTCPQSNILAHRRHLLVLELDIQWDIPTPVALMQGVSRETSLPSVRPFLSKPSAKRWIRSGWYRGATQASWVQRGTGRGSAILQSRQSRHWKLLVAPKWPQSHSAGVRASQHLTRRRPGVRHAEADPSLNQRTQAQVPQLNQRSGT